MEGEGMTELESGTYSAIVEEGKNRKLLNEKEHPLGSGDEVIAAAKWLINAAKEAYGEGARGEAVMTILRMAGELDEAESIFEPEAETEPEKQEPTTFQDHVSSEPEKKKPANGRKTRVKKEDDTQFMGLPLPGEWEGDFPQMPIDVTPLKDTEIRRLYSQHGYLLSRVSWLLGRERALMASAEHSRENNFQKVLVEINTEEKLTVDAKKAMASQDETVVKWDKKVSDHKQNTQKYQALKDVFGGNVDRLSREWSMRTESFQKEHPRTGGGMS
jgi:hypothetical protein